MRWYYGEVGSVGTSGYPLDHHEADRAVAIAEEGGVFRLHPEQVAQLGTYTRAEVVADPAVKAINGGHDWAGAYIGPRGSVLICSRREAT